MDENKYDLSETYAFEARFTDVRLSLATAKQNFGCENCFFKC